MGLNKAMLIGNLGRDPETTTTKAGVSICRMSIATTRVWFNKDSKEKVEETEWHRVSVWGKSAENCQKFLSKGSKVYIEGRIRTSTYEKDGIKRYSTEIVADFVDFLDGVKSKERSESGSSSSDAPATFSSDDDIPF